MVGPEAEKTATVRRFGAMFIADARLSVPVGAVVLRKAYGLGAMAMAGGDLHHPALTESSSSPAPPWARETIRWAESRLA